MERRIVGFHQDEQQHWIAELDCGHRQHMRHVPPWQVRPWVLTEAGRRAMIGAVIECVECARREMPSSRERE